MKKLLLTLLGAALALPAMAFEGEEFSYTYEGKKLTYTVISEEAKTVKTKDGDVYSPIYEVSCILKIPSTVEKEGVSYTVIEIGDYTFHSCFDLTSVTIPNSVTEIGEGAFVWCSSLTSVTLSNSITKIGKWAFSECTGLTSLTIPNSVTKIGDSAFCLCSGLISLTIPNSLAEIGSYAFAHCSSLTSVTYLAENPIPSSSIIFSKETYENATLNYLNVAEDKIAARTPWSLFKNRIGRDADFVDDSSISEVENFSTEAVAVYDMRGVKVGATTEGLPKGIYIVREGSTTRKIAI